MTFLLLKCLKFFIWQLKLLFFLRNLVILCEYLFHLLFIVIHYSSALLICRFRLVRHVILGFLLSRLLYIVYLELILLNLLYVKIVTYKNLDIMLTTFNDANIFIWNPNPYVFVNLLTLKHLILTLSLHYWIIELFKSRFLLRQGIPIYLEWHI